MWNASGVHMPQVGLGIPVLGASSVVHGDARHLRIAPREHSENHLVQATPAGGGYKDPLSTTLYLYYHGMVRTVAPVAPSNLRILFHGNLSAHSHSFDCIINPVT